VNKRAVLLLAADLQSSKQTPITAPRAPLPTCSAQAAHFDWRAANKGTPVRTQLCGTCWDFSAMGAYEGSYAVRNNKLVNTSEQYILNCAGAGNCNGGWWMPVFDYLMAHGDVDAADDPFNGNDQLPCPPNLKARFKASAWAFVADNQKAVPGIDAIKSALCQHGPLVTGVFVDPAFVAYRAGTFDEHWQQYLDVNGDLAINHGVVIIGWDDNRKAWRIAYNTNNIGVATAWVDAVKRATRCFPEGDGSIHCALKPNGGIPIVIFTGHLGTGGVVIIGDTGEGAR
jgi:C1A family cysteine protease